MSEDRLTEALARLDLFARKSSAFDGPVREALTRGLPGENLVTAR